MRRSRFLYAISLTISSGRQYWLKWLERVKEHDSAADLRLLVNDEIDESMSAGELKVGLTI